MRLTITNKIGLLFLIATVGALVALGFSYTYLTRTVADAAFINISGLQRTLSQKFHQHAHMIAVMGRDEGRGTLRDLMAQFGRSLQVMEQGGEMMGRTLPPAPAEVMPAIDTAKQLWSEYRQALKLIAERPANDPEAQAAYAYIDPGIHRLTEASDRIVTAFEARNEVLWERMLGALATIAAFDLILLAAGIRATRHYVAERHQAELEMRKLSRGIEQTADLIVITNPDGVIEYVNPAFEAVTGFGKQEALGAKPHIVSSGKQDGAFYKRLWDTVLGGEVFRGVVVNRKKDGTTYYEEKTLTPLKDRHGTITHIISTGKDITDRMRAQEQVDYLAYYDSLTGLPNRVLLRERLNHTLAQADRDQKPNALMFLDLDNFKDINDSLGHDAGDRFLQLVAGRLKDCVREGDTVARLGGDEFILVLGGLSHVNACGAIAQKLLDTFIESFNIDGCEIYVTTSIGITVYPVDGKDIDNLLKHADTAMYRAKELGGNRYQFYTRDMTARVSERLTLETQLRHALKQEQFLLHYQPKVDLASGRVIGMEALVRWQRPDAVLVPPADFIPLLEQTELIVPVGEWILHTACAQNKAWQDAGLPRVQVAVNVSARQFKRARFAATVARVLEETGLEPSYLELELTESTLIEHTQKIVAELGKLDAMGVCLSIDDFGTGYSSLGYLKRLPIRVIKIDRSFVSDIMADPDDANIARAIIAMAQSLNIKVLAEGVETEEQLNFLREHRCDQIQGYYFSRPLPVDGFTRLLREGCRLEPGTVAETAPEQTAAL